jgi:hypothetical protein
LEIRNAYQVGLLIEEVDQVKVARMHIHDTDGVDNSNLAGLRVGATNIDVSSSTFHDNYDRTNADTNGNATPNSSNMIFFGGGNVSVHHNLFYQTPLPTAAKSGDCLMYKHTQTLTTGYFRVFNNVFRQCKFFAVGTGTQNSYIHHNVIYSGGGFFSRDYGGPTHQNNQVFEYNTLYDASAFDMEPTDLWDNADFSDPKNIVYRRNVVYEKRTISNQEQGTVDIGVYHSDALYNKLQPETHFDHNCYFNGAGLPLQFNFFSANGGNYGVLGSRYTFAGWQAFGQDAGSINADPKFLDPAQADFRLAADSPCRDMGAYAGLVNNPPAPAPPKQLRIGP